METIITNKELKLNDNQYMLYKHCKFTESNSVPIIKDNVFKFCEFGDIEVSAIRFESCHFELCDFGNMSGDVVVFEKCTFVKCLFRESNGYKLIDCNF